MATQFVQIDTPVPTAAAPKLTLQWSNLSLRAAVKNPQTKTVDEKIILDDVSGYAKPGELLVIMGPSGAGKSSLLDCISGRNDKAEGSITVNGMPWSKSLKRLTSYVMQDDLFYQTITVREHLMFQARLRMGKTHTVQEYTERVDTVMEELGLTKCRDTLIGGPSLRGISGGERKRLSFATEILTNPSLLFVDEPTSGLDSFMAETVVLQLQQIARDGRTVIATIHQPSSELFALFDKLYLLSDGAAVYHGKASDSVEYFASVGYQCPSFVNPTDYFMRQLVVIDKASDVNGVDRVEKLKSAWRSHSSALTARQATLVESTASAVEVAKRVETSSTENRVGWLRQIAVLAHRNFVQLHRDHIVFTATLVQSLFVAVFVGLVYRDLPVSQRGIQNYVGAFYFLVLNQLYAASYPTFIGIPLELPIIHREHGAGLYHLLSWYLAKNVSELPMHIANPILAFAPAYFLINIGAGFQVFVYMQVMMYLINSCAVGLGYMISCWVRRVELAPIVGFIVMLPLMVFSGLLVNVDDAPVYFAWIQEISPVMYGFEGFMKLFWEQVPTIPCLPTDDVCSARTGEEVLRIYSMADGTALGSGLYLLAIDIGFRVFGFLGLWLAVRSKQGSQ